MSIKPPKRLWFVCGSNILAAGLSLAVLGILLTNGKTPIDSMPNATTVLLSVTLTSFLIVTSVSAFLGVPYSRWLTLLAAALFFGVLVLQQVEALWLLHDRLTESQRMKVMASSARGVIEIGLNAWALFSAKSARYFASRGADPRLRTAADDAATERTPA